MMGFERYTLKTMDGFQLREKLNVRALLRHRITHTMTSNVYDVVPHVARPDTWLTALRCLISFLIPLFFGAALGHFENAFSIALASGMVALADPRGSIQRRGVTLFASIFGGTLSLMVGTLAASSLELTLLFACLAAFGFGLMCEFGTAGLRCTFFVTSTYLMGAAGGISGSALKPIDILLGGLLPLILAFVFFSRGFWQRKHFSTRVFDFRKHFLTHLMMKTPIGRHAYRTLAAVGLAICIGGLLGHMQTTWATMSVMALLFPASPLVYKRGIRYILSTIFAVLVSFAVITLVHNIVIQAIVVAFGIFATAAARSSNYAAYSFMNALFYILVTMLVTGVGGPGLLIDRLYGVCIGILVAMAIAALTLPARERLGLLASMGLPLPLNEHIDDPYLARIRFEQVIARMTGSESIEVQMEKNKQRFEQIITERSRTLLREHRPQRKQQPVRKQKTADPE